ncbi:small ribosomal subunit protein mS38 [Austrofundulus limnaeus]|uniref:Small ribosomal subunit protein mS38 n=1 Tax=Austrofundulus limnaeus TaxID=52670 RepID=A0A2I4BF80_AUSLI|nr:PREDICTED: aurora kinase A-interacting protein [Austrofundulus limnaeus]
MLTLKVVTHLLGRTFALHAQRGFLNGCIQPAGPALCSSLQQKLRNYSTAADNMSPPRWVQLEPELDEALVPRKLSVSPLESWLSLHYTLPPPLESVQPQEDVELLEEMLLPPMSVPAAAEDSLGSEKSIQCKNVLKIRRKKMNKHKRRKLLKRIKFVKRSVNHIRDKKKQLRFEKDLERIWKRAGLKQPPEGWVTPKIFLNNPGDKKD